MKRSLYEFYNEQMVNKQNRSNTKILETDINDTMHKPQTAIQWLALRYHHRQGYLSQSDIAEALEMEREQQYYCANFWCGAYLENAEFDKFYKETYNK